MPTDNTVHEISKVLIPGVQEPYNFADLVARASAGHTLQISVVTSAWITQHTPPTDSELGILYMVPHGQHHPGVNNIYDEYVAVKDESTTPATYSWELIGTVDIDLTNYSLKTHTHTVTFDIGVENHTFTPTGTVSIPNFTGEQTNFHGTPATINAFLRGITRALNIKVVTDHPDPYASGYWEPYGSGSGETSSAGAHTHPIAASVASKSDLKEETLNVAKSTQLDIFKSTNIDDTKILETTDIQMVGGVVSTNDLYLLETAVPVEVCYAAANTTPVQNLSVSYEEASEITNLSNGSVPVTDRADGTLGTQFDVTDANFSTKHNTAVMTGAAVDSNGVMDFKFKPINTDDAVASISHTEHDVPIAYEGTPIQFREAVAYPSGQNTVNDFEIDEQITAGTVATAAAGTVTVATGNVISADDPHAGNGSPVVLKSSAASGKALYQTEEKTAYKSLVTQGQGDVTIVTGVSGSTGNPSEAHKHGTNNNGLESVRVDFKPIEISAKLENGKINLSSGINGYTPHSIYNNVQDKIQIANVANFNANFKGTTVSGTTNNPLQHTVNNSVLETSTAFEMIDEITVQGVGSVDMPYAVRGGVKEVTVYGACQQTGTPSTANPVPIVCNNGTLTNSDGEVTVVGTAQTVVDSNSPANTATAPMLLSVGADATLTRDECNLITGEITRRCEAFVYDGTQTLRTPRISTTGADTVGAIIVQPLAEPVTETIAAQTLDAVSNVHANTLTTTSNIENPSIQATYDFDPICDESIITESSVMNVVKHNATNRLFYVDPELYANVTIDTTIYTPMNYILWGMTGTKKLYMHKNALASGIWAEFNRYKLIPDTTQAGAFHWKITISGTVKEGDVSWAAGDTLASIVSQMTPQGVATYLTFTVADGYIQVRTGGYSSSTFTLTNASNVELRDLSKFCKVNGEDAAQTHRTWQAQSVHTLFPDSGYLAANTKQYAVSGLNLSYRCGGNLARFKYYFEVSGSGHGGVDSYLAESDVSARMSRVGFASCETGSSAAQALFNKYNGSWDEYMEASMIKLYDTHTDGIEYQSRDNGESQSKFLASVMTLDWDETTWIPAYPKAYQAAQIEFAQVGTGNLPTDHEIGKFMEDSRMARMNVAINNIGGTRITNSSYYWSVAEYIAISAWCYFGSTGCVAYLNKYSSNGARVVRAS
jgi:hypothetical protein